MATSFKNEGRFTKEDLERVDQSEKLDDDALEEVNVSFSFLLLLSISPSFLSLPPLSCI